MSETMKVLLLGFSSVQAGLIRKMVSVKGLEDRLETVIESDHARSVDAYLVNVTVDGSITERYLEIARRKPLPALAVGAASVPGAAAFLPGPFKPKGMDILMEMMQASPRGTERLSTNPEAIRAQFAGQGPSVAQQPVVSRAQADPTHSQPARSTPEREESSAPVLVVDDSDVVRGHLRQKIASMGVSVDCARSGEEAMAMVMNSNYRLVFLDVTMPGMDGFEVCRRFKRSRDYKRCAVYLLTSRDGMFDKVRGAMVGCDGYLTKPLENHTLRDLLQKHL